ncbi:MAG TPA: hemerythrin domain-containing protein [Burkholderiaceae bacterium]|nr:hemerythrin domain-containing protein [Burkholderiaceae bacterium]
MDAIDLLITQHRAIEGKMAQWSEMVTSAAKRELFEQVAEHLSVHIASEEQVFYPAVKAQNVEGVLLESLEEHLSLKRLLADLREMDDPGDEVFEAKFKVLKEQTEHHHEEEEENLFPKVQKRFDRQELERLGREMEAMQRSMRRETDPVEVVSQQTDQAAPLR